MDKSLLFIFLRFFLLFLEVFLLETMFFKNENKRRFFLLRWIGAFFIMSGILILVSPLTLMIYVSASYERQIVMITSLIGYFLVLACRHVGIEVRAVGGVSLHVWLKALLSAHHVSVGFDDASVLA